MNDTSPEQRKNHETDLNLIMSAFHSVPQGENPTAAAALVVRVLDANHHLDEQATDGGVLISLDIHQTD